MLEITDDEGAIRLPVNLKYAVIFADTGSPIRKNHIPWALSSVKPMSEIPNTRQRRQKTTISNKKIQIHVSQFILNINFGGFNPTPKYF